MLFFLGWQVRLPTHGTAFPDAVQGRTNTSNGCFDAVGICMQSDEHAQVQRTVSVYELTKNPAKIVRKAPCSDALFRNGFSMIYIF